MPRFEPFQGIRYDPAGVDLADVTAPPYDVIDPAARAALAARNVHNVVHIDCPTPARRGDEGGGRPDDHYDQAAHRFHAWQRDGVLIRDPQPSLYGYRMTFTDDHWRDRHTTGVIGAVGLEPPGAGDVLPHERTTRKDRSDRLRLLEVTQANLSAVWLLSLANGLTKLLDGAGYGLASWTDDRGVAHSLWRLGDPAAIDAICSSVGSAPLVIADGHHRYETCLAYQSERRAADGGAPGAYDLTLGFVVELVEDEIDIEPIHRLVSGLPDELDLIAWLARFFDVGTAEPAEPSILDRMDDEDALAMVVRDGARLLRPRSEALVDATNLDSSRVDVALAALPPHELVFQPGVAPVLTAVAEGRAQAGLLVRPPTINQIADVAHARRRMPPKTTFFWPKPRTGLVFRSLT
ncbi:MAG: DUF1015 family protein [Acidimicrobiales bacterium]